MEYQKSSRHGTAQRPDIVFHIPAEVSNAGVRDNNFAVWALKHSANPEDASEDFGKLDEMCGVLEYPLCFFLNIASPETYLEIYRGQFSERLHSFAIPAVGGGDLRHSYFKNGTILNEIHRIP